MTFSSHLLDRESLSSLLSSLIIRPCCFIISSVLSLGFPCIQISLDLSKRSQQFGVLTWYILSVILRFCWLDSPNAYIVSQVGLKAVSLALKAFSCIDALIINHGILAPVKRIADSDPSEWRKTFDVNFFSAVAFVSSFSAILQPF